MSDLSKTLEALSVDPDFVNLRKIDGVLVDLKYATADNFMSKNVYGAFKEAFLHRKAATLLERATRNLQASRPGWRILVLDALRPRSVQRLLWAHVVGTDQQGYVANPDRGSVHNYGCAIDLTLVDEHGEEVNMGTGFDTFLPLSQPKLEDQFVASGELSREHLANRLVLRKAMTDAGFLQIPHEWWHYDAFPGDFVRANFRIIE